MQFLVKENQKDLILIEQWTHKSKNLILHNKITKLQDVQDKDRSEIINLLSRLPIKIINCPLKTQIRLQDPK